MRIPHATAAVVALSRRELVKFLQQKGRLFSAFVRPALWLFVFAVGFRSVFGIDAGDPYAARNVVYEYYILPGLAGMVLLFSGMQSSLSMVYDREMGMMRLLLTAPLPRWYLLTAKLLSGRSCRWSRPTLPAGVPAVRRLYRAARGVQRPVGLALRAAGAVRDRHGAGGAGAAAVGAHQTAGEFRGTMNFVIFPMFFISPALFPLWLLEDSGADAVFWLAHVNPFTYGVQLIRYASEGQFYGLGAAVVAGCTVLFMIGAILGYDPQRGFVRRGPRAA